MKRSFWSVLVAVSALVAQTANADLVSCDFAAAPNTSILFMGTGNTIQFPVTSTYGFAITDATSPSLGGLHGYIGGTFVVGAITAAGALEEASVTTLDGVFGIDDGAGKMLTANLNWNDIFVYNSLCGALNISGATNLTNFQYSGSNSALLAIKNGGDQTIVLTFQFSPLTRKSLTQLMTDGQVNSTSYSGSLSSVPEPSSCVLLGMAALSLLLACVRRRPEIR